MKKFFGLFAAVTLMAAGIAPAFAADVELSGEVRVRYENLNNYTDFNDDLGDRDSKISQRTRLNAKVSVDDQTTAFISLQDTRVWGTEGSTATTGDDTSAVDLSQGYLEHTNLLGPVSLKIGRQALSYGDQRLIGGFEWSDNARRFDAIKFMYKSDTVDADLFLSDIADKGPGASDGHFNGLYVTVKEVIPANKLDVYYLQLLHDTDADQDENTIGLRLAGKAAGADWTAEFATQGGDANAIQERDADALAITAGYTLEDVLGGLRIGAEYFSGSGDDLTTTDDEGFNNLFPTNHFHYGINDLTGWTDDKGFAVKLAAKPAAGMKVAAEYWTFEAEESGTDIGTEMNLQFWYNVTEKTNLYAYYSIFDPDPSGADNAEKLGIQLHAKF